MAIIFQTILVIVALVLLYRLMIWIVPVLAGIGLGWLAYQNGAGGLVAFGVGVFGGVAAFVLLFATIGSRIPALRWIGMAIYLAPPIWAGAIATRSMAIQTGAEGTFWPLLAGGFGALLFGLMAWVRLPAMMEQLAQFWPQAQPAPMPAASQPPPRKEEPEPKVVYYQPMPPPRPKLRDGRDDDDRIIDI